MGGWAFQLDPVENFAFWNDFLTCDECLKVIEIGQQLPLESSAVYNNYRDGLSNDVSRRKSMQSWILPSRDTRWLFTRLSEAVTVLNNHYFKFNLFGLIEGLQFTRYDGPDSFFIPHIDRGFNMIIRKLSVVIQLSSPDQYDGGELLLYTGKDAYMFPKKLGHLACFPSYTLHEVRPVTRGTRYSLVAWVTGEPFK